MNSQALPIIINLIAAVFGALGQYFYKMGSARLKEVPLSQNWPIWAGVVLFTGVMVMFVWAFKLGGKISVTFPAYATTFLWGTWLGVWLDREPFGGIQWLGVILVVLGISIVASGQS